MNNCQDCKVTLISASAGFGKTTLIIEWILLNNLPVSWLSLDKDDNDPVRFLNYFIAALRRINPEFGGDILDYLELTTTTELEPVLIGLINEIAESFPQFLLVLDDYHLIESRYIHDLIIFLIENQPNQMHITVSTRSDPPWPLARLRVRGEITEIRIDDLRFTENEVAEFFNDVMGMNLSDSELISIYKRTEGWAAGLQMLALSLKSREDVTRFIHSFTGSHRFILDYLVEEVLNNQSPKIQDFLIKSSILERMNGKLCDAVIDSEDSWEVLNYLDRENLFIIPLDHERNWYRYHPLFKDLLNNQLEQRSPEQTRELNLRASNWFEREGYIEDAIKHAFHAKYYIKSADLVEHYAPLLISDGKLVTLNRWLELFPDWIFNKRPWLCIYQGWIRYWIGYRDQVEECLEKAEGILNKIQAVGYPEPVIADLPPLTESESEHIQGHIASIRSYNAIANERINYAMEMALKALELLPEWDFMRLTNAIT